MRLAGPDVVLFATGLILFSGSVYGLYATGALGTTTSPFDAFNVEWSTSETALEAGEFGTAPSFEHPFTVNATGVQSVKVVVECSENVQQATTTVGVTVTPPEGIEPQTTTGECGQPIEVVVEAFAAPRNGVVEAPDSDAARAKAAEQFSDNATGEWVASLTFTSSVPGPVPVNPVTWSGSVTPTIVTYQVSKVEPVTR